MRWLPFIVLGAVLYGLAVNGEVYVAASPPEFAQHVLLRKVYSIVAFAVLGAAYSFARRYARPADAAVAVALYSGLIEIGQWFTSEEPLGWNLFDVACGALGGALGAAALNRFAAARAI